jgi:hypothetical protein
MSDPPAHSRHGIDRPLRQRLSPLIVKFQITKVSSLQRSHKSRQIQLLPYFMEGGHAPDHIRSTSLTKRPVADDGFRKGYVDNCDGPGTAFDVPARRSAARSMKWGGGPLRCFRCSSQNYQRRILPSPRKSLTFAPRHVEQTAVCLAVFRCC